jgi:hypothetical protein
MRVISTNRITDVYDLNDAYNAARRNNRPGLQRLIAIAQIDQIHDSVCRGLEPDCMKCFMDSIIQEFNKATHLD